MEGQHWVHYDGYALLGPHEGARGSATGWGIRLLSVPQTVREEGEEKTAEETSKNSSGGVERTWGRWPVRQVRWRSVHGGDGQYGKQVWMERTWG